jgi:hypothetical protein
VPGMNGNGWKAAQVAARKRSRRAVLAKRFPTPMVVLSPARGAFAYPVRALAPDLRRAVDAWLAERGPAA